MSVKNQQAKFKVCIFCRPHLATLLQLGPVVFMLNVPQRSVCEMVGHRGDATLMGAGGAFLR